MVAMTLFWRPTPCVNMFLGGFLIRCLDNYQQLPQVTSNESPVGLVGDIFAIHSAVKHLVWTTPPLGLLLSCGLKCTGAKNISVISWEQLVNCGFV
jgi:hypothetical protein